MSLLGQFVGGMLKQKPKVPTFKPIDATEQAATAITGNRANFAQASALASEVDQFNQQQLLDRVRALIPDLDNITSQVSGNISSMTRGQIPEDVAAQVARTSASKAFRGGFGGSQRAGHLTTRDLGLTSLQLTDRGLDSASKWLQTARSTLTAPQMDVTSMFITPAQQIQNQWQNETARINMEWLKNQITAQHDWRTQLGNSIQQTDAMITQSALGLGGSLLGGMGGMGGGGFGG